MHALLAAMGARTRRPPRPIPWGGSLLTRVEPCPAGCGYENKPGYVRQHVERSTDELHRAHREARKPVQKPEPQSGGEAPALAEKAAPEAAAQTPSTPPTASVVEVDFGGPPPPAEAPLLAPSTPPTTATAAPPPADEIPPEVLRQLVVDEAAATTPAAVPIGVHNSVMAQGILSPGFSDGINRFIRGATNRWILDEEAGDTPLTKEEVEELGTPQLLAQIAAWCEAKWGWQVDINHPVVWLVMWGLNAAALIASHRAPREEAPQQQIEAAQEAPAESPAAPARTVTEDPEQASRIAEIERLTA